MKSATATRKKNAGPVRPDQPPAAVSSHLISEEELHQLQENLREAQETLDAIRSGDVDAVIVNGENGEQIYSLTSAEQPYRVYIERMQEGAVTVSTDGIILYCNRRFAEMLRRSLERVIGTPLQDCLPREAWLRVADVFDGAGGEVVKCETTLRRESDSGLPVHLTASRLSPGDASTMCLVVTDLTAQKENADLKVAKEIAERASAAKDDFLAALSHELRTPLTPALLAAAALEKDVGLPESARSDLALIRRNVELEARLIDDLLDLTLITHGRLVLQDSDVNVHTSLHRAIETCQDEARRKRLTLQIELGARQTHVRGDPVRIQQVCWNILRNAVKFTSERGSVTITTGNDEANVWIRFHDTGIGFMPDQANRIFEPFETGGRHVTRQFGGLGLGLAISRSVMEAHRGALTAQSPGPNQGATFTLTFPLAAAKPPGPSNPVPAPQPAREGRLNILLVEDHKDTRMYIQRLLEAASHRIASAGTADEALKLAETNHFDLVISDLGLPDLSGHELMRRLHARFALPGIALSGYGMENDVEESRKSGFKYHLTKPVSFDRLKSLVAEFTANRPKA
jgi:PAS domain S-box-containing protein